MVRNSVQPRGWTFVKDYGFLYFAEYMGKNIGKNKCKNLSGKCSQKLFHHAKKRWTSTIDELRLK